MRRIYIYEADKLPYNSYIPDLRNGNVYDTGEVHTQMGLRSKGWMRVNDTINYTDNGVATSAAWCNENDLRRDGVRVQPNTNYIIDVYGYDTDPGKTRYLNFNPGKYPGGFITNGNVVGVIPNLGESSTNGLYRYYWNSGPDINPLQLYSIAVYGNGGNGPAYGVTRIKMYQA